MVKEIVDTLTNRIDKDTLKLGLPAAFKNLKGKDAKLESSMSNTLQPLNLFYGHNKISESVAYVFVNTESKGLLYTNAVERGESAEALFKQTLQFN